MTKLGSITSLRLRFFKLNDDAGESVFKNLNTIDTSHTPLYLGTVGRRLKTPFRNRTTRGWLPMDIPSTVIIVDSALLPVFSELLLRFFSNNDVKN